MATLDDSPSLYLGQQWTHWAEKVEGKSKNDHPTSKDEQCSKDDGDTIKLRHQDMPLYGLCPARDEFYLVVCECCEQVVKPQALKRHIEQRHGVTSQRTSGARKSKGSPGRHSGSPARHTSSPGRHVSPKRDSHAKTPINPSPVKNSSKSSSSSHRSSANNAKSKKSNHSMPVVKVERMLPSAISSKSNSSPSTKVSSIKHEHSDHKEHKYDKEHRDHSKDGHREHKHEKEHREKDYQEHNKDHREHSREHKDHKDKDHKHDKEHKEKEHPKEKEHVKEKEHAKEKDRREHTKDRDHRERERERDRKDRDRDRDRNYSKEKDHRAKDHERQEKEKREKDKSDSDHKEKSEKAEHREKEHREKEKEQKEKERKEKELKERKEKEQKEKERKDKELKERERKEKEKELRENERKEKELKERERKEKEHKEKEQKERDRKEKERKEKEHKDRDQHKDHRDHKDHREKKSASASNSSLSISTSQTTSSVTPPRPSSSHKASTFMPSPSTVSSSSMTSPSERSVKQKPVKEKMLPCKDREFDANKHCGVWISEIARQCTRSLTCKTHALSLRRGVKGRRKPFDELLKEHRAAKEAFLKAKAEEKEAAAIIKAGGTPTSSTPSTSTKASLTTSSSGSQSRDNSKSESGTAASASAKAVACTAMPVTKSSKPTSKVTSSLPSRAAPPPAPPPGDEVGPDSSSRLSSDDDDDNDERDRLGFPLLSHQPRPAVVNSFGGRRYSGSSCIVFNRKSDFLRAAFHACVERHLHPPPYKKLCVESKLPQGSNMATNAHDPYDFPTMDLGALATNGLGSPTDPFSPSSSHNSSLKSSWNSNKLSTKVKPKSTPSATLTSPMPSASRNIRPKDLGSSKVVGSGLTSPMAMVIGGTMTSPITPITPTLTPVTPITPISRTGTLSSSSVSLTNSSTVGVKRKRSGSGTPVGGVTMHQLQSGLTVNHGSQGGNPISISIPSGGLNSLNLTQAQINSLNETILKVSGGSQVGSHQQGNKNHLNLKDVNIVMTSRSDPSSVMNGQFVTTTTMPTSAIADIASLQLNSLGGEMSHSTLQQTQTHSHKKRLKLSHGVSGANSAGHGPDGVGATVSTLTSLPSGMMVMSDLTSQQTTFTHSFGSTGLLTASADFSASKLSPSNTSPLFASGSASPQTPGSSPMANGMFGHGLELKVNHGLPVNHVAGAMMVSPGSASSTPSPQLPDTTHHRSSTKAMRIGSVSRKSSGSRSKSHSRTQLTPQVAATQQLTATAITLASPGSRLLSTTLPTMYTMETSSGKFQHIQIQPKASSKQPTLTTSKLPMLTIPMTTVTSPQQQAHATLLLQNDDHQLSGAHHHAAAAQQLQNSPSNVLS